MNIGLTAHNSKKTLLESFCIAYKGIFKKHTPVSYTHLTLPTTSRV